MNKEEWRLIPDYPNYMISNLGRVKSLNYNHTGKPGLLCKGLNYENRKHVQLWKNGVKTQISIHVLVAKAFVYNDDPVNKTQVHHINGDIFDNRAENLIWITFQEHQDLHNKEQSKRVCCYDLNWNLIKVYSSIRQVAKETGFNRANISACCNHKPHHNTQYGFRWEFMDE